MARAEGIRVTEFFLGMPCRYSLSWKSKKYGTRYGITPLFLGGYNKICGLAGDVPAETVKVLGYIESHGRADVKDIAEACGLDEDSTYDVLAILTDWATVEPYYNPELGEKPTQKNFPKAFQTVCRDSALRTEYDKGFDAESCVLEAGEPQDLGMPVQDFLEAERARTYQGKGFWKRFIVLFAGPSVNLIFGIFAIVIATMTIGVTAPVVNTTVLDTVQEGSPGAEAGILAGDEIVAIGGVPTDTWEAVLDETEKLKGTGEDFSITVLRDGKEFDVTIPALNAGDKVGISVLSEKEPLSFPAALAYSFEYIGSSAKAVSGLLIPTETAKVVSQSTSIVGITVVAGEAAEAGALEYLSLAAMVSVALGLANLLPVPPLDGGRIVVEALQKIRRKPFRSKTLEIADAIGVAAFLVLFVIVLRQDIIHLMM